MNVCLQLVLNKAYFITKLTDKADMNYLMNKIRKYDKIKIPTFRKSYSICTTAQYKQKNTSLVTNLIAKPLNQSSKLPHGHHINVHTSHLDDSLLVEVVEKVRGQKISIFLFTLTGVLLKRTQVKKIVTVIDIPFTFNKDYLMNVQIDDSIYTWRITRR